MPESLTRLEARRAEVTELLEEMTAMGVYEGTLNVLRSRARKLDGDITAEKARHRKVDPFKQVIGFRGGKVPDLPVIPPSIVNEAMQMHVERRSKLIRQALIEEGADPDHVDAINDPARRAHAETIPPIADDILDRVRRRIDAHEFDEPFSIPLPQEEL